MSADSSGVPREFLLKQIENEIDAAFTLVAAARKAYRSSDVTEGDGALTQALVKHSSALKKMAESEAFHVRAISHQLGELREAIDWLQTLHFTQGQK